MVLIGCVLVLYLFIIVNVHFIDVQLPAGQILLRSGNAVPVRSFAKEAAPSTLKGDGL